MAKSQLIQVDDDPFAVNLVPVDHDPFVLTVPAPSDITPDSMKLGGGQESAAERALRVGIEAAGGFDLAHGIASGARVLPQLERGETGKAVGSGLEALGYGAMGIAGMAMPGRGRAAKAVLEGAAPRNALRGVAAPAIRTGERPLFPDIGYGEVPRVPQFDLPRKEPAKDLPERVTRLADPENLARMDAMVREGIERGSNRWYNFEPLRYMFKEHLGEEEGEREFANYINMVGSSTNMSTPMANYRDASFYYGLNRRGEPLPEPYVDPETGKTVFNPKPYGHLAQQQHRSNALNIMEGGEWNTLENPKPPSFAQNQMGNLRPYTLDTVGAAQWGMTDTKGRIVSDPPKQQYGFIENLAQQQAEKMGIPTAWWQAGHWIGGMDPKRLASERARVGTGEGALSGPDVIEYRIKLTAQKRGEAPQETLRKFIVEGVPLLSVGGAGMVLLPVDHDPFEGDK